MNILIVYAHHEPKSMNGAMYRTSVDFLRAQGHQVRTTDLYAMQFDPVSDRRNFKTVHDSEFLKQQLEELYATEQHGFDELIELEIRKLEWCDMMIWQFPLWWFSVPAILKGWVDRVFAMGRVYGQGRIYQNGVFKGKKALLSFTTGGAAADYKPDGFNGDLYGMLRPLHRGVLEFTGFSVLEPHVVYGPARREKEDLEAELNRWKTRLSQIENEESIEVGQY